MVTERMQQEFEAEGYFVLESALTPAQLDAMRDECRRFMDVLDEEFESKGVTQIGLSVKGNRYFVGKRYKSLQSEVLRDFLFGDLMAEVAAATLGRNAYVLNEQFVVKGADTGMKFAWHQDSGYVGFAHQPYITVWCALDDVSVENGTIYVLPFSKAGTRELVPHREDPELHDKISYEGNEKGTPVEVPAGSIAVFSSLLFHRSGANTTSSMRRAYTANYTREPLRKSDGSLHAFADPLLLDGERQRPPLFAE